MGSMRILLAVHQFFPEFRTGTETLTRRTAEELKRRGYHVWILTAGPHDSQQPLLRREVWQGLNLIRFNPPPEASPLAGGMAQSYRRPEFAALFRELLQELQPDLLHAFHLRRHTLSLVEAAQACGVRVVASLTDYWFACPTGQLQFPEQQPCRGPRADGANCLQHLAGRLAPPLAGLPLPLWQLWMALARFRWLPLASLRALRQRPPAMAAVLARCERVLVPSQLLWNTFSSLGFDTRRFEFCPYGIDLQGLAELPARQPWRGVCERPLRLGFIGSFNRAKGAHVLLEALARLGPAVPLHLQLYGNPADDPAYAAQLRNLAAPLPQVHWAGVFASEQVFAVINRLDLLVVPSLWRENAPLILLQALASGLPLLVSDVAGMADQVQVGENALLFEPGDAQALADQIRALLEQPQRLLALSGRGGRPRSIADYGEQLDQLYARLQRR
jgi:glycosyltransferase involved in cell wall biosynthesis